MIKVKNRKVYATALFFTLSMGLNAFAGGERTGNGGDVISCTTGNVTSTQSLDFFEMTNSHHSPGAGQALPHTDQVQYIIRRVATLMPHLGQAFQERFDQFSGDSLVVDYPLANIPDTGQVNIPDNCSINQVVIRMPSRLPFGKQYIIRKQYWDALDEENKAAVMLHEIVYGYAVDELQAQDSKYSRALVGSLMSYELNYMSALDLGDTLHRLQFLKPSAGTVCGTTGSIANRIASCSKQNPSSIRDFVLVTRSDSYMEVYQDTKSGLLWSDVLPLPMSRDEAQDACNASMLQGAGINNASDTWRLPAYSEFYAAKSSGILDLANMGDSFSYWTSTLSSPDGDEEPPFNIYFNGEDGVSGKGASYSKYWVRCVLQKTEVQNQLTAIHHPDWKNAYQAPNGTLWSDILPLRYANCITEKDPQGHVLMRDGSPVCKKDSVGNYIGTSADKTTVIDSDAVQACKEIGGIFPSLEEAQRDLTDPHNNVPNSKVSFSVSNLNQFRPLWSESWNANAVRIDLGSNRGGLGAVRCIGL